MIGDEVRRLRLARGWTLDRLAEATGAGRATISNVEMGKWNPSLRVALALARVLDTTVEELAASGLVPTEHDVKLRLEDWQTDLEAEAQYHSTTMQSLTKES